jgi:hypothetical protein
MTLNAKRAWDSSQAERLVHLGDDFAAAAAQNTVNRPLKSVAREARRSAGEGHMVLFVGVSCDGGRSRGALRFARLSR